VLLDVVVRRVAAPRISAVYHAAPFCAIAQGGFPPDRDQAMRMLTRGLPAWQLLLAALLFGGHRLEAQERDAWKRHAIFSVMHYRAVILADTATKFDRCTVERHAGAAAPTMPPHISEFFQRMLARCHSPDASRTATRWQSGPSPGTGLT
jgi:hypothetical protein